MGDSVNESTDAAPYHVESNPSAIVKSHTKQISVDGKVYELTLVVMKRTFLLAIKTATDLNHSPIINQYDSQAIMSGEALIHCFMNADPALQGLSLAIGHASTCLIPGENSVSSSTLANRLSRKLNSNRPVYVSSGIELPNDICDVSEFMSKFYLKTFQFVNSHYKADKEHITE